MSDNFITGRTRSYIYAGAGPAVLVGTPGVGEISLVDLFSSTRIQFVKDSAGRSFNPKFPQFATLTKLLPSESYLISVVESFSSDLFLPSSNPGYTSNLIQAISDAGDIRPRRVQLVSTNLGSLDVYFEAPIGYSPISYTVQLSRDGNNWSNETTVTTTTAEYRGLLGGDWFARVRANYAINSSDWRTTSLPRAVRTPPPSELLVSSDFPNTIQGSWTPPANVAVSNYTLAITLVSPDGTQNWINSQTLTTPNFTLGSITPGVYIYRVRTNITGAASSNFVYSEQVQVLGAGQIPTPLNLSVRAPKTGTDAGTAEVSWTLPTGITITSLTLERSASDGTSNTWQGTQTLAANAKSFTYTGLAKGTYLFRIRVNTASDSSAFAQTFVPFRVFDTRVTRNNPKGGCSLGIGSSGSWIEFDAVYGGLPGSCELQISDSTIAVIGFNQAATGFPFRFYYALLDETFERTATFFDLTFANEPIPLN